MMVRINALHGAYAHYLIASALAEDRVMSESLKPAAFYGRVSVDDEESLDSQLAFCRERAHEDGYYIPDAPEFQFSDVHEKGTRDKRRGLDALDRVICAGQAPPFERMYVRDAKRLGGWRDPRKHDYIVVKWEIASACIRYCDMEDAWGGQAHG